MKKGEGSLRILVAVVLVVVVGAGAFFLLDARFEKRYRTVVRTLMARQVSAKTYYTDLLTEGQLYFLGDALEVEEPKICLSVRADQCSSCQVDALARLAVLGDKIGFDRTIVLCQGFSEEGFSSFSRGIDNRLVFIPVSDCVRLPGRQDVPVVLFFTRGIIMDGRKHWEEMIVMTICISKRFCPVYCGVAKGRVERFFVLWCEQ